MHAAIILLLVERGRAAREAGGGGAGPRGGGEGGVQFFTLPAAPAMASIELPPPPSIVPPAVPAPALALPPIDLPSVPAATAGPVRGDPGTGAGGAGGGRGAGVGTEEGAGSGGDARNIFPPNPRGVIVPPENPPKGVRGRAYRVQFWVGADGRVERVAVTPEIPDEKYRRDFQQRMLNYRFYPAKTRDGRAVPHVVAITITP